MHYFKIHYQHRIYPKNDDKNCEMSKYEEKKRDRFRYVRFLFRFKC